MRAYLSSFRVGGHPEALTRLAPAPGPAVIIANACDDADPADRRAAVTREEVDLATLGYRTSELDLRDHVDDPAALRERLTTGGLVWVRGGNVFALRHAMLRSGADRLLVELLRADAIAYAG